MSVLVWTVLAACGGPCGEEEACHVHSGAYYAFPPSGWNGTDLLAAVVHSHGMGGSPGQYYRDDVVRQTYDDHGVLLLLPIGQDSSDNAKHLAEDRDEVEFVHEILDHAGETYPIDDERIYGSGFSVGGSVASVLACESDRIAAIAPTSGGFWVPMPTTCETPPMPVLRTHGSADNTWPLDGRQFSFGAQSALDDDLAFWREHNSCTEATESATDGALECTAWTECDAPVTVCMHEQGHTRLDGWAEHQLTWMLEHQRL